MNRGSIRDWASRFCGDPAQSRYANDYNEAIDKANEQFALDSRALWKDVSWSVSANDADQDLSSDFMFEEYAQWNGKPLSPISRVELAIRFPGRDWTADTATEPSHFIIDPEEATKEIVVYPIPTEAGTLSMRYYPLPAALSGDTSVPLNAYALMSQFHLGIAAYAAWLILTGETQTDDIVKKRNELLKIYNDFISKAVDRFKNTQSEIWQMQGKRATWGYRK
jgi:hypothetical protein